MGCTTGSVKKNKYAQNQSNFHGRHSYLVEVLSIRGDIFKNASEKGRATSEQKMKVKKSTQQQREIKFSYSYRTRQGSSIRHLKMQNQDSLLIKKLNGRQIYLFAVADGHGPYGDLVSQCIAKNMGYLTETQLNKKRPEQALQKVFYKLQKYFTSSTFANDSGSTLVSILLEPRYIICANTGDSRAILVRQIDQNYEKIISLSQDHKLTLETEKERILQKGGVISCEKDKRGNPVGCLRVWVRRKNTREGLAMSRSMGDNIFKKSGVISTPEIRKIRTNPRDRFIILASDGLWQILTNKKAVQLIFPFYLQNKIEQACDALLKEADKKQAVRHHIDDVTFILVFLNNF